MPSPTARTRGTRPRPTDAGEGASTQGQDPAYVDAVEHLGAALAEAGISRLPSRVFAALLTTESGRMTSAELGALLAVSPAAVSGAVGYLTQVRMIRRERERGSRRDVYVVMDDAWHDVLMQKDQIYAPLLLGLAQAQAAVAVGSRAEERLQLSVEFLEFIQHEMDGIAVRWDAHKAARS